jgi:hypothetical protein
VELAAHNEREEHDDEQRHQGERNGGAEFAGPHVSSDDPRVKWLHRRGGVICAKGAGWMREP